MYTYGHGKRSKQNDIEGAQATLRASELRCAALRCSSSVHLRGPCDALEAVDDLRGRGADESRQSPLRLDIEAGEVQQQREVENFLGQLRVVRAGRLEQTVAQRVQTADLWL